MIKLALRNLIRQKLRTAIPLAAIVFGVAAIIVSGGFVADMFIQLGEALIHSQSGHLQLAREGYFTSGSRSPEKHRIADPEAPRRAMASLESVEHVMARIHFSGLLSNGRTDWAVAGEGVEPGGETRLGTHIRVIAGRSLEDQDRFGLMLGQELARVLGLAPGDRATLLVNTDEGALNTLDFAVVGVFQSFSKEFDARAVRIPLRTAQELLGTQGVNVLVVVLKDTRDTAATARAVQEWLSAQPFELRTWQQLNDFYDKTVTLYERQFGVLQLIVLAMVLLSVANTVNMSVFERIGEFGTMMALGNSRAYVFRLILTECVLLGSAGSVLGVLLGVLLALCISAIGIPMPPPPNANIGYEAFIRVVPHTVVGAATTGFLATILAGLLPAQRISRTPVAVALRANI